jgi:hypothetical protein
MTIHINGSSKVGVYGQAAYSGHMITDNPDQAAIYVQDYMDRNWDIKVSFEN